MLVAELGRQWVCKMDDGLVVGKVAWKESH